MKEIINIENELQSLYRKIKMLEQDVLNEKRKRLNYQERCSLYRRNLVASEDRNKILLNELASIDLHKPVKYVIYG